MHRTASSSHNNGLFAKGASIFGGGKTPTSSTRPSTSSGSPTTHSESSHSRSHSHSHSHSHSQHSSRTSGFSRKPSFSSNSKSPQKSHRGRQNSTSIATTLGQSPEKRAASSVSRDNHSFPATLAARQRQDKEVVRRKSTDSCKEGVQSTEGVISPASDSSTAPYSSIMLTRPQTGYSSIGGANGLATGPASPTLETITYQHIQEMASKRISTLDYLRKAHEGRVYWFNTLLFNKPELQRMPYFDSRKLARRATNYLLLGLSLPTVLDLNGSNAQEFLKSFNALLAEFESYQQIHPPDGSTSLGRGRFPQMFKRATTNPLGKGRRTSSAAEIGLPMGNDNDMQSTNGSTMGGSSGTSFPIGETDLLPGEEYTLLLTPSLPFDPDFYETFATLCDVLIDCYTKLMSLVSSPRECTPYLAEMFTKADARVRKIIVQGVVKEFEDSSRSGVRSEVAGVGKVVLGGLM